MSHKPDFEQIKPGIAHLLENILNRRIHDFFVDTIVHPYTNFTSEKQFWEGYMDKTLDLLCTIKKKSIPLVFRDCYVVFFHKPQMTFQEGDFFFQAGASTPGTLAVKFYWNDTLRPATVMESELPRLTDEQFYKEKCRESNAGTNVFRNLILWKGKNEFERLPISDMFQLLETMSERDLIGSEMTSEASSLSSSGYDTEQRSRASSLPERRRAKSFTFEGMSFTGNFILTPKADREKQSPELIRPPYVTQPSSECHQPNAFVYSERDEEPHPMAATVQDEESDTGNSPAVIARELGAKVEALELGGQTSASGYPDARGALASLKKDGGKESSGYPGIDKALPRLTDASLEMTSQTAKQNQEKKDASPADFLLDQSTSMFDLIDPQVHLALRNICTLLDKSDPLGNDWRALWTKLTGRSLKESDEKAFKEDLGGSPTIAVLNKWQQQCSLQNATVGHLLISLKLIHRSDAVDLLRNFLKTEFIDFPSLTIDNIFVLLSKISPVVGKELTPSGLNLTISEGKCRLSIPPGAVDVSIPVSSCLLTDGGEYRNETAVALTDVVRLLPHGTKLKKAATLKLKHNFTFREKHTIKVTLLYESGTDSRKRMKPLCVFTTLNQVVSFRFGHAVLLPDQIIIHTTSFCHTCGRNDGCRLNLSMMVLALSELNRQPFKVILIICSSTKQKQQKAINAERGGLGPQAYKVTRSRPFDDLCECEFPEMPTKKLPVIAEINSFQSTAWSIDTGPKWGFPREISFRDLQAISKNEHSHRPYDFVIGFSHCSRETVDDHVIVTFGVKGTRMQLSADIVIKDLSSLSGSPRAGLSLTSSDLDRKVTEEELQKLAPYLTEHWKALARKLKINKDYTVVVERKNRWDSSDCPHDILHRWLDQNGSCATVRRLCIALIDKSVCQRNAAEEVYGTGVVSQVMNDL
ncbi:uncharacterized protein [Oscarella lobularis]|uniref:uncharacterized protein isoform X2 n=1 Tax=Oscarella lobularis TaxID=121494 RepID=UPI00331322C9